MSGETVDQIADRVIAAAVAATPKGGEVRVVVGREAAANVRFARNEITTGGERDETTVNIAVLLGTRQAWTSTNQTDAASVAATIERALLMARLSPEDPETMPVLPAQTYRPVPPSYDERLAAMGPAERAAVAARAIATGDAKKVQIAGFFERHASATAIRTSRNLAAGQRSTEASYTVTARTTDASGSGWAGRETHRLADLDDAALAETAVKKALASASPRPIPTGKYTVILEPQAVAEMLSFLVGAMDRRAADEGRSYFTGKIGQKLFAGDVSLRSDPFDPLTPAAPFDHEGLALSPQSWIEGGVAKDLFVSRYWAEKKGLAPTGHHRVHQLSGGTATSTEELLAGVKRGLLVTRFWYNRMLEPQTVMITGLTRDGLFLVEDGRITAPVTNFRYNESPVNVLKTLDGMTKATVRVPMWNGIWHVPAVRAHDFTMASPSAAV
ncbi:MAG: TldD/PmbA family protein [Deltaproteobacteria bacterium]|nr:TldD/PmbA family protein [Deltaproteobacteria bacterium]